mgnify:CR=1 FL=1
MKNLLVTLGFGLIILTLSACGGGGGNTAPANAPTATSFVHVADSSNSFINWTVISHPELGGDPDAVLLVTQNRNPGGVGGIYNDNAIGVWYDGSNWAIFNQDTVTPIPDGAAFNIRVITGLSNAAMHVASPANKMENGTFISHPDLDSEPTALFLVTQNWNPGGGIAGIYNDNALGVLYETRWFILNQDDTSPIPDDAAFNMQILNGANDFVHIADAANSSGNTTTLSHPALDGNPNATIQVTQIISPGNGIIVYNNNVIGVWYDGSNWSIFNQNIFANIPDGSSYAISID